MSDFLPDEIVTEIISRLPAKSLIRFRCVSKPWNSLITSPIFINSHLTQSSLDSKDNLPLVIVRQCDSHHRIEEYKLFLDTEEAFDEYKELVFPLQSRRLHFFYIVGYAKGLFCFYEQDHYYLWNPSIRKCLTLPKPHIMTKTHGSFVDRHGFGFDSPTNDYKVVRIALNCGAKPSDEAEVHLVEVYSLNSGSWRLCSGASDSFPNGATISYSSRFGTYLKGAVHFAAEGSRDSSVRMVLSFDLGCEVFQNMLLPNGILGELNWKTVTSTTVFRGLLTLLCYDQDDGNVCSIWTLKEYGVVNSWYKQFTVNLSGGIKQVLGIRNNGHLVLEAKSQFPWQLSSYDPCLAQLKNLGIHGRTGDFHVYKYEENLILLNKTNDPTSRWGVSRKRKDRQQMRDEYNALINEIKAQNAILRSQVVEYNNGLSQSCEACLSTTVEITPQLPQAVIGFQTQLTEIEAMFELLKSKCAAGSRKVRGIKGVRERR